MVIMAITDIMATVVITLDSSIRALANKCQDSWITQELILSNILINSLNNVEWDKDSHMVLLIEIALSHLLIKIQNAWIIKDLLLFTIQVIRWDHVFHRDNLIEVDLHHHLNKDLIISLPFKWMECLDANLEIEESFHSAEEEINTENNKNIYFVLW